MSQLPLTRISLIARLKDAGDHQAWQEFTAIYEPLLWRLMRARGLQPADAQDACQQVLVAVAKDVQRFKPDGQEASFRRWLFRIARNRALKLLARQKRTPQTGTGTAAQLALEARADCGESLSDAFERQYKEQLLATAAEQIRDEFKESTWQAFWRTCIEQRPAAMVAAELGLSVGNVYVARSRIVARLREKVQAIEGR